MLDRWLTDRQADWCAQIRLATLDPAAGYRNALTQPTPRHVGRHHFHAIRLGNPPPPQLQNHLGRIRSSSQLRRSSRSRFEATRVRFKADQAGHQPVSVRNGPSPLTPPE